jgi:ABC-type bacteriocin/lantibiotic exporter with double-glycine peptidase domain
VFSLTHPDISHLIQLAIAPVFLLTAVGTLLGVLSNRLGRVVDRIRELDALEGLDPKRRATVDSELALLTRRMRLVYTAMASSVFCALFVGLLMVVAFIDAFVVADLWQTVGALFIAAMLAFIGSLCVFLREIFIAVTSTHSPMR